MGQPDISTLEINVGDNVRVVYPKHKHRSPHRTDGIYQVLKIDASYDVFWVKYLEDTKKLTIVKRSYIQDVVNSKFKGLD
jgi:hypothetical protein